MSSVENFFELFSLPLDFSIDQKQLNVRFRKLQRQAHPDRFVGSDEKTQLASVQRSTLINQAYQTLKSPLRRGVYLLEQAGLELKLDTTTISDPVFLMQQMELREQLEEINDSAEASAFIKKVKAQLEQLQNQFALSYVNVQQDPKPATAHIHSIHFIDKLLDQAQRLEERLIEQE